MKKPNTEQSEAEQAANERPRRAARKPSTPEYFIYFMPDGKSGERVKKGSVPMDVDPFDHIEERTDLPAGLYRIEKRKGGEFAKDVGHYTKEDFATRSDNTELEGDEYDYTTEDASTPGALDVEKIIRTVLAERDRRERTQQGQPSMMDMMREMRAQLREEREAVRAEIAAMQPRDNPARREPELSDRQRLELAVIKETGAVTAIFHELRGALGTVEHVDTPETWGDWFKDVARDFVPHVAPMVAPLIGQRLTGLLGSVDNATIMQTFAPPQNDAQPGAQEQPQAASDPLTPVLRLLIDELTSDADVNRSCDALDGLLKSHPEYAPTVAGLLEKSSLELVAMLAQLGGAHWLPKLPHGILWCDSLKDEVRERAGIIEGDESEESGMNIVSMARTRAQAS
jgi:hypothetical protein